MQLTAGASIKACFLGADWVDLGGDTSAMLPIEAEAHRLTRLTLEDRLLSALTADSLVVLTGLGTSLSLSGVGGEKAAPTMWDLFEAVSAFDGFDIAKELAPAAVERGDVEGVLSSRHAALALNPDHRVSAFARQAERHVLAACSFVDESTDLSIHELFLRKVARRSTRLARTKIFTTNYDLAFEAAADRARFTLIDGFDVRGSQRFDGAFFDQDVVRRRPGEGLVLESNVAHLLKLHGSVDWDQADGYIYRRPQPIEPVLIYPSQSKYQMSFRPPYLECMSRFHIALREPDVALLVVGFGFNDAHIAAPIESALRSNVGMKVLVVAPNLSTVDNASVAMLRELTAAGDGRVTLLETKFDSFTAILPDIAPDDEREAHRRRVEQVSGQPR
ncbi:SIR2 family protein [Modestobacter roseus]|uniref:SIR2 family protein n=1 Tax=Modestobacter roseus TaxID=1181884 RepID=UPI0018862C38|nr:SIR2 family protein [Modestobacter roseus]